jgi:hypothetical protein
MLTCSWAGCLWQALTLKQVEISWKALARGGSPRPGVAPGRGAPSRLPLPPDGSLRAMMEASASVRSEYQL